MLMLILTEESKVSLDECHTVACIQLFCVQTLKKPKAAENSDFPDPSVPMQAEAA